MAPRMEKISPRPRRPGEPNFSDLRQLEERQARGEHLTPRDHFHLKDTRELLARLAPTLSDAFARWRADLRRRGVDELVSVLFEIAGHPAVWDDPELRAKVERAGNLALFQAGAARPKSPRGRKPLHLTPGAMATAEAAIPLLAKGMTREEVALHLNIRSKKGTAGVDRLDRLVSAYRELHPE